MNLAIVCDWLTSRGGAERVIIAMHELFPSAPIFTALFRKESFPELERAKVITSWLQHVPLAKNHHQWFLPFYPSIFEQFDLSGYDVVLSSSHACAKGVITKPETLHIGYCHSPMRYVWDESHQYVREYSMNPFMKFFGRNMLSKIRLWDRLAADRVDLFLTNSEHVKKRIKKYYKRDADVIYPGIPVDSYHVSSEIYDYFLAVGRLSPYKRFDLLISAFNELGLPLKIVGRGVDESRLKAMAKPNIEFLGFVSEEELHDLYAHSRAFLFPQEEDFGITPLEAMASGRPVIAYRGGGALETILEGETGMFFDEQNSQSLTAAVQKFQKTEDQFDPMVIRKHAKQFSDGQFKKNLLEFVRTHGIS